MGLRFFSVAGWGWIVEMGGCIARCAHPLEKSTPNSTDTSIHRLPTNFALTEFSEMRRHE
jgi:hypothetical protein